MVSTIIIPTEPTPKNFSYVSNDQIKALQLEYIKYWDKVLLFRDEYVAMESILLQLKCEGGGVVISGNPGIGIEFDPSQQ